MNRDDILERRAARAEAERDAAVRARDHWETRFNEVADELARLRQHLLITGIKPAPRPPEPTQNPNTNDHPHWGPK